MAPPRLTAAFPRRIAVQPISRRSSVFFPLAHSQRPPPGEMGGLHRHARSVQGPLPFEKYRSNSNKRPAGLAGHQPNGLGSTRAWFDTGLVRHGLGSTRAWFDTGLVRHGLGSNSNDIFSHRSTPRGIQSVIGSA